MYDEIKLEVSLNELTPSTISDNEIFSQKIFQTYKKSLLNGTAVVHKELHILM